MTSFPSIYLLLYSLIIFIFCSFSSYWIHHQVQSPTGNILYFLAVPLLILFYLIQHFILNFIYKKQNLTYSKNYPFAVLKLSEISFYWSISAFVLISHLVIYLISILSLISIIFCLCLKTIREPKLLFTPYYDLILLMILASILAYVPELHQQYSKISIQHIDLISNGFLIFNFIILSIYYSSFFVKFKKSKTL